MNELKAKLQDKAAPKPAGHQLDPADDEDQRKLFVGGLAQVNISLYLRYAKEFIVLLKDAKDTDIKEYFGE